MSNSFLTTPKHWYGRGTRRDFLGAMVAGIGVAGLGLHMNQMAAIGSGGFSPVAIPNPAQSGYAWVANHGLDGDAYQREFDSLGGQGYRLIKLCGYSVSGQDYYASIWDMSPGPAWVGMHRVPGADYQGVFDANVAAGLRPLRVSGFTVGGADYFASIWVGDDGTPWAAGHGMDNATYQAEFDRLTAEGLRLVDISGYEMNGADYYAAIFDGSPKPYWISHHNLSADAYQAAFNENGAAGYVLTHVAGYGVGGQARFAGIWASDTDPTGGTVGVAAVDKIATDMLATSGVPGVQVAIARDGLLVYAKGYGTADASTGEAMTVQHRMRVASVSKPITAAAILQLAENGTLALSDTVFGSGGWLGTTYGTKSYSTDLRAVTIDHLVNHTVGAWGGNTMFQHPEYSLDELITWTLDTFPLSAAPGGMFTYSNFGYCLLGRIIEAATGQTYESYVRSTVLADCGISDMQIAGDSLAERAANEVVYDGSNSTIGDPYGIPVRRMDAHGGWIATATDLLRFMVRMDDFPNPTDIVTAASLGDMGWGGATNNWGHTGQLGGTEAVISRRTDGICYAVIGNGNGFDPDRLGADMAYAITDWGAGSPL